MKKLSLFFLIIIFIPALAQKTELVIRRGHVNSVSGIALSPDKKMLLTCGQDGTIIFWNASNGLQVRQYQIVSKGNVSAVCYSSNGKYAAVAADNKIAIFDGVSTALLDTFPVYNTNTAVVFSKDNHYLVSTGWNGLITVWRTSDRKQVTQFIPYEGMYDTKYKYIALIKSLAVSPDGKKFILGDTYMGSLQFDMPQTDEEWRNVLSTRQSFDMKVKKMEYTGSGKYLLIHAENDDLFCLDAISKTVLGKISGSNYDTRPKFFCDAGNDEFIYAKLGVEKMVKLGLPALNTLKILDDTSGITSMYVPEEGGLIYATNDRDNFIRGYSGESLKQVVSRFSTATNISQYVAVHPSGNIIAVNSEEMVVIYNVIEGRITNKLKLSGNYFHFCYPIQFNAKGDYLYISEGQAISQWSVKDWKLKKRFDHSTGIISGFSISPDGNYLTTVDDGSNEPALKLWNTATGQLLVKKTFTQGLENCSFSNNGKSVAVIGGGNALKLFSVPSLTLFKEAGETVTGENILFAPDDNFVLSFKRNAIYSTTIASGSTRLLFSDGTPSEFEFPVWAVAMAADKQSFISSGRGSSVVRFDLKDVKPVRRMTEHGDIVRSISVSDNGKYYATSGQDGKVILRNSQDKELCSFFTVRNQYDWALVAPDGRFDASQKALDNIYFHRDAEIIPLATLYEKFYNPRLLPRLLEGEIFPPVDVNDVKAKPIVSITYAAVQRNLEVDDDKPVFQNNTGTAEITVHATSPDDTVDEIRLFHNGKAVNLATRNLFVTDDKNSESEKKYLINLLPGKNTFRAVALNSQRTESNADEIDVIYKSANPPPVNAVPVASGEVLNVERNATLYLLVVGINKYANPNMSLNYALADANAFRDELETGAKTMINTVKTFFVADDNASHSGIISSFKEVQANAKPQDVFVFYYAGHGVIGADKEFYLVPQDVSDLKNVQDELKQRGIASKLMQQYAVDIKAQKQLFVLDACQSAGAFATMLSNDGDQQKNIAVVARSTGTHWIAASGAQQFANEFSQLGHGAFTYVLLQALKGQAASNKMVTVNGLKNYLQLNVPELMKKYNGTPQYPASYGFGNDFPVELVR